MAFCKFFGQCPVCKFQDISYEDSLRRKVEIVEKVLERKVEVVPSPKRIGWRVRVILHARRPEPNNLILGYTLKRGFVFGVDSCPILDPKLSSLIKRVNGILASSPLSVWDAEKGKGTLVSITLVGDSSGVVLSLNLRRSVFVKRLTYELMDRMEDILGVWWSFGIFAQEVIGGRGELFRAFRVGGEAVKVTPYGEYPDNIYILPSIWKIMRENLKGEVVSFMSGIYAPLDSVSTYVDNRGMVIKEFLEMANVSGTRPEVRTMTPKAFLTVNRRMYDYAIVHLDRVKTEEVLEVAKNAVLISESAHTLKRVKRNLSKVYLIDSLPYTSGYLLIATL